ncbi:conjugal transfer protein, partial [Enterococcus faecalis]
AEDLILKKNGPVSQQQEKPVPKK